LQVSTINLITQAVGTLYDFLLRRRLISQSPVVSETIAASAPERELLTWPPRVYQDTRRCCSAPTPCGARRNGMFPPPLTDRSPAVGTEDYLAWSKRTSESTPTKLLAVQCKMIESLMLRFQ